MNRTDNVIDAKRSLIDQMNDGKSSAFSKYQQMFVGRSSWWALIKYELVISFLTPFPGALGYFLRKTLFPTVFQKVGRSVFFGRNLTIRCPERITIGTGVTIDDNSVLDAKGKSLIELGNEILIGRNTILSCTDAQLRLGSHISIGPNCYLTTKSVIEVGSNVSIGPNSYLVAGTHAFDDLDKPIIKQDRHSQGIIIEEGAWIGAGVIIQDGVKIGKGAIIGSGAVVTTDIPENSVAVGVPAKVIKSRG